MNRRACLVVVCILALLLTACTPQAEVAAPSATPIMAAVEVVLPAAEPTSAPVTPTPTPSPAPTAVPEWVGIKDNGVDGVGTVRGNTNGNLMVGGDVASDGETVYYFRDCVLVAHDIRTGKKTRLLACDKEADDWDIPEPSLNLYRGYVYFIAGGIVRRIPAAGGEVEQVSDRNDIGHVFVAYNKIFMIGHLTPGDRASPVCTVVLDAETLQEEHVLPRFRVHGGLNGRLYGWMDESKDDNAGNASGYASIDPDGKNCRYYSHPDSLADFAHVACDGYIYVLDNMYRMGGVITEDYDFSGRVLKIDVETDETEVFPVPDIPCSSMMCLNVTPDYIYIQRYGWDGNGDIWRMSTDGQRFSLFDKRTYHSGISLVGDVPAMDYIGDYDDRNNGNEADP